MIPLGLLAAATPRAGGGPPPSVEPDEHTVVTYSQSTLYAGQPAISFSNMNDANGNGDAVTGTATQAGGTQWLKADLGSAKPVSRIRIGGGSLPGWGNIFPTYAIGADFLVQYSNDDSAWTTANNTLVPSYSNSASANRDVDVFVPPVSARYWRISRGADIALATLRVFGYTGDLTRAGITYSQSTTYSTLSASEATLNEDPHNATTGAATNTGTGQWIAADLGEPKIVAAVMFGAGSSLSGWGSVDSYLNGCVLEYSTDNSTWTHVLDVANANNASPAVWVREVPLIEARYWRLRRVGSGYVATTAFRLYTA